MRKRVLRSLPPPIYKLVHGRGACSPACWRCRAEHTTWTIRWWPDEKTGDEHNALAATPPGTTSNRNDSMWSVTIGWFRSLHACTYLQGTKQPMSERIARQALWAEELSSLVVEWFKACLICLGRDYVRGAIGEPVDLVLFTNLQVSKLCFQNRKERTHQFTRFDHAPKILQIPFDTAQPKVRARASWNHSNNNHSYHNNFYKNTNDDKLN